MAGVQGHQEFDSLVGRNEGREMGKLSGSISLDIWVFVLFGQWTRGVGKTGPVSSEEFLLNYTT